MSYFGEIEFARSSALGELVVAHHRPRSCLDPHRHETSYVSLCLNGSYLEDAGGLVDEVNRGDLFVHPREEAHANDMASQGATILNLRVSLPIQRLYNVSHAHRTRAKLKCSEEALGRIETICSAEQRLEGTYELLRAADIILPLLASRPPSTGFGDERLNRAITAVEGDLEHLWTLEELASIAGYHPVYFGRKFRERFGCPPIDHVRRLRMRAALRLMCGHDVTATEAAHAVGFFDSAHMANTFRKALGASPTSFRQAVFP